MKHTIPLTPFERQANEELSRPHLYAAAPSAESVRTAQAIIAKATNEEKPDEPVTTFEQFVRDPEEADRILARLDRDFPVTGVFPCGKGFLVYAERKGIVEVKR